MADQEFENELREDITDAGYPQTSVLNPNLPEWVPIDTKQTDISVKEKIPIQKEGHDGGHVTNMFDFTDTNNNSQKEMNVILPDRKYTEQAIELSNVAIAKELNKPKAEIKVFDGNLDFKSFERQFQARIVTNTDSYDERLNYLLQFTSGEPQRIAKGFSHLNAKSGYDAAWTEFHEKYGDSDVIAHAYVKRAINWPTIKPDNPKALDEFAIFLRECQYAVNNVEAARVLEYSENLKHLVQKLPFYLHQYTH